MESVELKLEEVPFAPSQLIRLLGLPQLVI